MNAADRQLAVTVPCPICEQAAGTSCVVDGQPRDEPHVSRLRAALEGVRPR